jgi:ribonuclease Z
VALSAQVKQLMLGHYSARYNDETVLLRQAQEVFPNTILSNEGLVVNV